MKRIGVFKDFQRVLFLYLGIKESLTSEEIRKIRGVSGKTLNVELVEGSEEVEYTCRGLTFSESSFHRLEERKEITTKIELQKLMKKNNIFRRGSTFLRQTRPNICEEMTIRAIERENKVSIDVSLL